MQPSTHFTKLVCKDRIHSCKIGRRFLYLRFDIQSWFAPNQTSLLGKLTSVYFIVRDGWAYTTPTPRLDTNWYTDRSRWIRVRDWPLGLYRWHNQLRYFSARSEAVAVIHQHGIIFSNLLLWHIITVQCSCKRLRMMELRNVCQLNQWNVLLRILEELREKLDFISWYGCAFQIKNCRFIYVGYGDATRLSFFLQNAPLCLFCLTTTRGTQSVVNKTITIT